ncbi:uncharacterized protein LOC143477972 [Brachyhypopomus gauderio]|uniref:uncharacterized protein LOC143477972 n=1 Tax=Brachyhypopomus gauderio TaxID=698409 RepID=UPI004041D6BF
MIGQFYCHLKLGARTTSSFGVRMVPYFRLVCGSMKFTRCLLEFPKFTINDVRRIVRASSTTPQSKLEKGFKFYVSSYLCNFEVSGKSKANEITVRAHCYRSMKKTDMPHQLRTAHYSESGMSVVPPVLSCTQTEQKWHKPRTMGVKPGSVDAMVVLKPKPGATTASGVRSTLFKGYSGELPHPATLNPGPVYAGMKADSLPLICTMNISPDKQLVDSIFGKAPAVKLLRKEVWRKARHCFLRDVFP